MVRQQYSGFLVELAINGNRNQWINLSNIYTVDIWYALSLVYDQTQTPTLTFNSEPVSLNHSVGTDSGAITPYTGSLQIGRLANLAAYNWIGAMQMVAGFGTALSRADQLIALNSALPTGVSALTA